MQTTKTGRLEHKFPYLWKLKNGYPANGIEYHGCTTFGTFICGGGSTMGLKQSGYNHLGGVEIDKKVADVYKANHKPHFLYNEDLRAFNKRTDLPKELFNLDLLDGSPPCSTFSNSGEREESWGKEKVFREGQAKQTLDDLVFIYCDTIEKLMPKVAMLENVKGLIQGNAKFYCRKIIKRLNEIGYRVQIFLLNSATMGVPQSRERVFFIALRNDIHLPKLVLNFNEKQIAFGVVKEKNCTDPECFEFPESERERLKLVQYGDVSLKMADRRMRGMDKNAFFNQGIVYDNKVMYTITSQDKSFVFDGLRRLSNKEFIRCSSFPSDYNFKDIQPKYLMGMSVPPIMTAQIAHQIYLQWLSKL